MHCHFLLAAALIINLAGKFVASIHIISLYTGRNMMMMMIIEYLPRIRNRMSFSGAYPGLFWGRVGAQLFYFNTNKPPSFFPWTPFILESHMSSQREGCIFSTRSPRSAPTLRFYVGDLTYSELYWRFSKCFPKPNISDFYEDNRIFIWTTFIWTTFDPFTMHQQMWHHGFVYTYHQLLDSVS